VAFQFIGAYEAIRSLGRIIVRGNAALEKAVAEIADTRTFVRFLSTFVQSLRRTIEVPFDAQLRQRDASAKLLREMLRDIESARISIGPLRLSTSRTQEIDPRLYLAELSNELVKLTSNSDYLPILKSIRFRMLPDPIARQKEEEVAPRFADGFSAYDAILAAVDKIHSFANPPGTSDHDQGLFELRSIVPSQKIAPTQFDIKHERLTLKKTRSTSREEDEASIRSARSQLQSNGDKIIKELQQSNCDRRLLDNIQHLQTQLLEETDAIKIGLTGMSCEFMCSAFEQELPSAVSSMLKAHTRGVQLFVGQFPEWNRFLENAATAHLEGEDVSDLRNAAKQLIEALRAQPGAVDPEVPKTFAYLSQLLENPSAAGKKAAFAVLRSIENLISLVFTYGAEFGQKTVSKTIDTASNAASKIIVVTLLTIALGGAAAISPIANKVPEMSWIQTASQLVKKQLEELMSK
jgi:hypothetical protein